MSAEVHLRPPEDAFVGANAAPSTNAGDAAQVGAAEQIAQLKIARDAADLAWVLADARGRRFIESVLELTGMYRSSYSADLAAMAANEGTRNVGLQLVARIEQADPMSYVRILAERQELREQDRARVEAKRASFDQARNV